MAFTPHILMKYDLFGHMYGSVRGHMGILCLGFSNQGASYNLQMCSCEIGKLKSHRGCINKVTSLDEL